MFYFVSWRFGSSGILVVYLVFSFRRIFFLQTISCLMDRLKKRLSAQPCLLAGKLRGFAVCCLPGESILMPWASKTKQSRLVGILGKGNKCQTSRLGISKWIIDLEIAALFATQEWQSIRQEGGGNTNCFVVERMMTSFFKASFFLFFFQAFSSIMDNLISFCCYRNHSFQNFFWCMTRRVVMSWSCSCFLLVWKSLFFG